MNLATFLVLLVILSLFFLAARYISRHKHTCTDCGLSGACPLEDLKSRAGRKRPCPSFDRMEAKPTAAELRMMVRK